MTLHRRAGGGIMVTVTPCLFGGLYTLGPVARSDGDKFPGRGVTTYRPSDRAFGFSHGGRE
jgi:hypothetical protein